MKKISLYSFLLSLLVVTVFTSCGDNDNYDAPNANFSGELIDVSTGKAFQAEQPNGFKIKWTELSWKYPESIQPDYFWGKPDGTFNWDQAFAYKDCLYEIQPEQGAFVVPEAQQISLKKGKNPGLRFEVIPYIHIEWQYSLNGTELEVKFTATRPQGSTNLNLYSVSTAYVLLTDKTKYVGAMNTGGFDRTVSKKVSMTEAKLGAEQTSKITLISGTKYYLRVGVQTNNPAKAYNYTEIVELQVP